MNILNYLKLEKAEETLKIYNLGEWKIFMILKEL